MQVEDLNCKSSINLLIARYHELINSLNGSVVHDPCHYLRPLTGLARLRRAAVFVGLQFHQGRWSFLLTLRKSDLKVNGGDVCFPGGKFDKNLDSSIIDTAVRESKEEIGLQRTQIQLLGQIPPIISKAGFLVHIVLGIIEEDFIPSPNKCEVEDVLYVTALDILSPVNHRQFANGKFCGLDLIADYFDIDYGGHIYTIHGLTGAVICLLTLNVFDIDMNCQLCNIARRETDKSGGILRYITKFLENFDKMSKM